MNVQQLIEALQTIEDKTLPVTFDAAKGYDSIENVEVDDICECESVGWINNSRGFGVRKVVLLME